MRYRQLGNTGMFVSEICLGTMTFGGQGSFFADVGKLGQKEVAAVVARAFEAGVNFIDTADMYSFGLSETLLGQALKEIGVKRSDVVIATKAFARMASPRTMSAPAAGTSWIRWRKAWSGCRPITSTFIRFMPRICRRRSRKSCVRSTIW